MSNRHHTSTYHKISIKDFFPRIPKLPSDLKLVHWGPSYDFFQHHFFQVLIFMSNRHHTSTYHKISIKDFFPRIPKLPSDLKLVYWGLNYDFFQHHFFQALVFTSNRRCMSTYYKISINDFFPRIPKLPSDLKLVHWGPSYGSSSTIFFKRSFLCQIATIRVRIIKYQSQIFSQGFQNCPQI